MAALLNVSLGTVSGWESGKRSPKTETEYVARFQALQVEAGEQPGFDDKPRVAYLWRTHLNNVRKGSRVSRRRAAA
jgi:transcriptional regulator with XRE-family HTH domain